MKSLILILGLLTSNITFAFDDEYSELESCLLTLDDEAVRYVNKPGYIYGGCEMDEDQTYVACSVTSTDKNAEPLFLQIVIKNNDLKTCEVEEVSEY